MIYINTVFIFEKTINYLIMRYLIIILLCLVTDFQGQLTTYDFEYLKQTDSKSNSLFGTWLLMSDKCSDPNGNPYYFKFNSDGTGEVNSNNCNKICTDSNFIAKITYTFTDNTIDFKYDHKNGSTCKLSTDIPWEMHISSYTISNNILSIGGANFKRKED